MLTKGKDADQSQIVIYIIEQTEKQQLPAVSETEAVHPVGLRSTPQASRQRL